jgi:O-antigen ligase
MYRRVALFTIMALMALSSIVTVAATIAEQDYMLRGYVDASQDSALPFRIPRLGVNAELTQYTDEELQFHLHHMASAHMTWVRQIVRWDQVESAPGEYQWAVWDKIVSAIGEYSQLQLVAVFMNTPLWARRPLSETANPTAPPYAPADFANFVRSFAERYRNTINYYQIWDEPNLKAAWGGSEPRVADYVALLAESYEAVHSVDSDATVISAALAPTIEVGPDNISDIIYLQNMYELGAKAHMDAVAAKPYGFNYSPDNHDIHPDILNFERMVALREVMTANGDGAKALWASNWGWNSLPDDWRSEPSIWGQVTSEDQVRYTLKGLERAEREWPWVGGMVLQHWQPATVCDDPVWGFSLVDCTGTFSVLYDALANAAFLYGASNGLFPAENSYARYSGVWTFGNLGADIGWLQDSQFEFDFYGTDVSLLLRQDDYTGYLYPRVDNKPVHAVPHDATGNAYVVLTSESLSPEIELVSIAQNLPLGSHTLQVVADRGWDRWALAGYGVSSGNLHAPYTLQVKVGGFVIVLSVLAVVYVGRQVEWGIPRGIIRKGLQSLSYVGNLLLATLTAVALLVGMLLTWGDFTPSIFRREPVPLGLAFIAVGFIKLQPAFILTIAALIILFLVVYYRLDVGIALTLFFAPFFLFPVELYQFAFPLSEVLILVTSIAWLTRLLVALGRARQIAVSQFRLLRSGLSLRLLTPMDYGLLGWLGLGLISLVWADHRMQAITELRVMFLEPVLFYLIIRTSRLSKRQFVTLLDMMLLAGLVVALIGLWQYVQGVRVITAEAGALRLASVYGSPNNVALFLGRCFPFVLAFTLSRVDAVRRVLSFLVLVVIGVALLLTQSVGAVFLGIPAAIFVVTVMSIDRRRRQFLVGSLVVVALAVFLVLLQFPRFARVLDLDSGTNFFRIRVWQSALNVIADHPITGLGLDQFLYAFRGKYIMPDAWQEPNLSHPHNIILDFWIRLGVLGVAALGFMQVVFWRRVFYLYKEPGQQSYIERAVIVGAMGAMANLVVHGMVDNSVYVQDLCYVFVFLLALANWDGEISIADSHL